MKVSVYYTRSIDDNVAPTALGEVTVHIPRGDHARPLSRRSSGRLAHTEPVPHRAFTPERVG